MAPEPRVGFYTDSNGARMKHSKNDPLSIEQVTQREGASLRHGPLVSTASAGASRLIEFGACFLLLTRAFVIYSEWFDRTLFGRCLVEVCIQGI